MLRTCLNENLALIQKVLAERGHSLVYEIKNKDFLEHYARLFETPPLFSDLNEITHYDVIIVNPPFVTISKISAPLLALNQQVHAQANLFCLWLAISARLLKDQGQLVCLAPRHFCSSFHFKNFRRWLLQLLKLELVHTFQAEEHFSLTPFFEDNVILKLIKSQSPPKKITIVTSSDLTAIPVKTIAPDYVNIILPQDRSRRIPLPTDKPDLTILEIVHSWKYQLVQLGYRASRGKVNGNRDQQFLLASRKTASRTATALLGIHHLQNYSVHYPLEEFEQSQAIRILPSSQKLLVPNQRYILVKCLSPSESFQRVYVSYYSPGLVESAWLGIERQLLYISKENDKLSLLESLGMMALLNSSLINSYFSIMYGNRLVGATEINKLTLPDGDKIIEMGTQLNSLKKLTYHDLDSIVSAGLDLPKDL